MRSCNSLLHPWLWRMTHAASCGHDCRSLWGHDINVTLASVRSCLVQSLCLFRRCFLFVNDHSSPPSNPMHCVDWTCLLHVTFKLLISNLVIEAAHEDSAGSSWILVGMALGSLAFYA